MITQTLVCSRKAYADAEDPRMKEPHLLIQILGEDEGRFPVPSEQANHILRMRFHDVFEESPGIDWIKICQGLGDGRLADSGLLIERTVGMMTETVRFFGVEQARILADWIFRHHASQTSHRLIIHCLGGVSRSAAVAAVMQKRLGIAWESLRDPAPNTRVMRLMRQAIDELIKNEAKQNKVAHV